MQPQRTCRDQRTSGACKPYQLITEGAEPQLVAMRAGSRVLRG